MKHQKVLGNLTKMAEDMTPVNNFRIVSSIHYRNRVISHGFCSLKSHPFQKKYSKNDQAIFIHAENAAIFNALRRLDVTDMKYTTLYVARIKCVGPNNHSFIPGMAKPCIGCQKAIAAFGIRNVYYTTDDGYYSSL